MQDISIKIEPKPSKLYFYQRFYEDLENYEKKFDKFSITDFACGGSKILGFVSVFLPGFVGHVRDFLLVWGRSCGSHVGFQN